MMREGFRNKGDHLRGFWTVLLPYFFLSAYIFLVCVTSVTNCQILMQFQSCSFLFCVSVLVIVQPPPPLLANWSIFYQQLITCSKRAMTPQWDSEECIVYIPIHIKRQRQKGNGHRRGEHGREIRGSQIERDHILKLLKHRKVMLWR